MDSTFGHLVLSVNQIIDGKTLTYGYCNRTMPEKLRTLQSEFHLRLSRWITSMSRFFEDLDSFTSEDSNDYKFLKLCVENIENISKESLDWYMPN